MRDLKADLKLCEEASPGPWWTEGMNALPGLYLYGTKSAKQVHREQNPIPGFMECFPPLGLSWEDASFIAAARTGWPETIQELIEARKRIEELEAELKTKYDEGYKNGYSKAEDRIAWGPGWD